MRIVLPVSAVLLAGCAAATPGPEIAAACMAQGHAPGTEAYRVCMDAGGAAIATGPGSPYAKADEDEDPL